MFEGDSVAFCSTYHVEKNNKENLANAKPMARVDALVALMSIWKVQNLYFLIDQKKHWNSAFS
jgi:hypothetical protein